MHDLKRPFQRCYPYYVRAARGERDNGLHVDKGNKILAIKWYIEETLNTPVDLINRVCSVVYYPSLTY